MVRWQNVFFLAARFFFLLQDNNSRAKKKFSRLGKIKCFVTVNREFFPWHQHERNNPLMASENICMNTRPFRPSVIPMSAARIEVSNLTTVNLHDRVAERINRLCKSHPFGLPLPETSFWDGGKCSTRKVFDGKTDRQCRVSLGWVLSENFRVGQPPASHRSLYRRKTQAKVADFTPNLNKRDSVWETNLRFYVILDKQSCPLISLFAGVTAGAPPLERQR